jgi:hypothetical protein
MHSDGIYLNLSYYAQVEIEIGIKTIEPYLDEDFHPRRSQLVFGSEHNTKCLYPEIYLSCSARILDDKIVDLQLDDWDLS